MCKNAKCPRLRHTYLTPHISFTDFQSQKFGKVLSQLCDTGILVKRYKLTFKHILVKHCLDLCAFQFSEIVEHFQ